MASFAFDVNLSDKWMLEWVPFAILTERPAMVLTADGCLLKHSGELMTGDDVAIRIAPDDPRTSGWAQGTVPTARLVSSLRLETAARPIAPSTEAPQ